MPSESYSFLKRQKPTRMPYSCQAQFGTSGSKTTPVGAGKTWRAIGRAISQTSRLTTVQTMILASPGSFKTARSTMAEYGDRSLGIMVMTGYGLVRKARRHYCSKNQATATRMWHPKVQLASQYYGNGSRAYALLKSSTLPCGRALSVMRCG